jgi:hypothetical protein
MALLQNTTFRDDTVELDGNEFEGCEFHNCRLVYRGIASVKFRGCSFFGYRLVFEGAAQNTLGFLADLFHSKFRKDVEQIIKQIRINARIGHGEVGH